MAIDTYRLPAAASDVPDNIRALYRSGGFDKAVRDWHLARIPRYTVANAVMIMCPYCGKWKDRRSMQIDHIIPAKVYVRYKMLRGAKHFATKRRFADILLRSAYNDKKNLVLSCMRCNSGAQDRIMDQLDYQVAAANLHGSAAALRMHNNWDTLKNIGKLQFAYVAGRDLKTFVMKGCWWGQRVTRNTGRKAGATTRETDLIRRLELIEAHVIMSLVRSRPQWTVSIAGLEADQPSQTLVNEELRLCYYCLGLFKKQAFQIDHINPASRRSDTPAVYNDPTNLVPACRTCNTSKGNAYLSTHWLDLQVQKRQTEGLPGIEHATNLVVPPGYADAIAYGVWCRRQIFGH